jgi:hypothetical protein
VAFVCPTCGHPDHGDKPCTACSPNGTCWQKVQLTGGDGDQYARGAIQMATGVESRPCMMCAKWEKVDVARIVQHFLAKGLEAKPDGTFVTPIVKDFPGRKSLVLDPHDFGFCRRDMLPTDLQSTCAAWTPTKQIVQLQRRMRG